MLKRIVGALMSILLVAGLAPAAALATPIGVGADGEAKLVAGETSSARALVAQASSSTYKVEFVPNGGKGKMKTQTVKRGKATALRANSFKRAGYKFAGWNTKKNGKGKTYKNKAKVKNLVKAGKTVKLYAQWKKAASYTIKTSDYTFAIPEAWRGKVTWEVNKGMVNPIGKFEFDAVTIYLKGHKGDSSYELARIGAPTGFSAESVSTCFYQRNGDSSQYLAIFSTDWAYLIGSGGSRASVSVEDRKAMLKLVTGGRISYEEAARSSLDSSSSHEVVRGYLRPLFKKAFKSQEYYLSS